MSPVRVRPAVRRTSAPVPPPLPVLDFFANWRHALGTTAAALGDGPSVATRKFDQVGGSGAAVIANPGTLGFPVDMANLLQVNVRYSNGGYTEPRRTGTYGGLVAPAVGQTRYHRIYLRITSAAGVAILDPEMHPYQDGPSNGSLNWGFWVYQSTGGPGKWTLQWRPQASVNAFPNDRWQLNVALDHDRTYRIEHAITRDAVGTFKAQIRIYDEAISKTVPQWTGLNFINQNATFNLDARMAAFSFALFSVANMVGLNTGSNGLGPTPPPPQDWPDGMTYSYQGGVASGLSTWCGVYNPANG